MYDTWESVVVVLGVGFWVGGGRLEVNEVYGEKNFREIY